MKTAEDFKTQKEFFHYLVKNKRELIEFKRQTMKLTDALKMRDDELPVVKSLTTSYKDDLSTDIINRTIIANTYNWMDSHCDVHLDNCFARSISERTGKIWHLHDHEYKITSKVGVPKSIYEKSVAWNDLGVDVKGSTMCLMADSEISKELNPLIFNQYVTGEIDQHSVGMVYLQIDMAINDAEYKEEFSVWNKHIEKIGNKEKAVDLGFFFAVKEAKLVEFSCVLEGSNELTPTVANEEKKATEESIDKYLTEEAARFKLFAETISSSLRSEPTFYERLAKELSGK